MTQMMNFLNRHFGLIALLVVVLGFVFTAAAQQYTTSGSWKGATVRLGTATTNHLELGASGDAAANDRYVVRADGRIQWGGGAAVPDTELQRTAASTLTLSTGDTLEVETLSGIGSASMTVDGDMLVQFPVDSVANGNPITANRITLATDAGDYEIPITFCDAAADIGNWFTLVAQDDSVALVINPLDANNVLHIPGLDIAAGDEADMTSTAAFEGAHITLVCLEVDNIYATSETREADGTTLWADGGSS